MQACVIMQGSSFLLGHGGVFFSRALRSLRTVLRRSHRVSSKEQLIREAFIVMNVLSKLKSATRKSIMLGAVTAAMVGAGLFVTSMAPAAAETYNCDSNAVIYCGASSASQVTERYNDGVSGHNTATSIHHIYSHFGISSSDIQSIKSTAQMGTVTKSGDVYIGSKLVATDAVTAGRENIAGSKTVTYDGTTFYTREPKVSFLNNSLDAYVVMQNGQFKYAILVSCGNPVIATPVPAPKPTPKPTPTPCYQCTSLTDTQDARNQFTFTAKAEASNGAVITGYVFNYGDGTNQTVSTSAASTTAQHTYSNSGTFNVSVSALVKVNGAIKTVTAANCATTVKVTPVPTPTPCYQCTSLTDTQDARNQFTFTAKAEASNGAVITGYVFNYGDGTNQTVSTSAASTTAQHTYSNSGTFNVSVSALVKVNGAIKTVTAANCATTVKVCPPPAAECTELQLSQNPANPLEVKAIVTDTTSNGATLNGVSYDWGDSVTTPAICRLLHTTRTLLMALTLLLQPLHSVTVSQTLTAKHL